MLSYMYKKIISHVPENCHLSDYLPPYMYSFCYNVQFVEVNACVMEGGIANSVFIGYFLHALFCEGAVAYM